MLLWGIRLSSPIEGGLPPSPIERGIDMAYPGKTKSYEVKPKNSRVANPGGGYGSYGSPGRAQKTSSEKRAPSGGYGSYGPCEAYKPEGTYGSYGKHPSRESSKAKVTPGHAFTEKYLSGKVALPEALRVKIPTNKSKLFNLPKGKFV